MKNNFAALPTDSNRWLLSLQFFTFIGIAIGCSLCASRPSVCLGQESKPEIVSDSIGFFKPIAATNAGVAEVLDGIFKLNSFGVAENPWDVQLISRPIDRELNAGDVVEFTFEGRSITTANTNELALAAVYFAKNDPWETINKSESSLQVLLDSQWRTFHCVSRADRTLEADSVFMTMHCSSHQQSIEVRDPKIQYWGNTADESLPFNKLRYEGQDATADWRSDAEKSIRENRMSPATIRVTNAQGQPIVGVKVRLKQRSHSYGFGTFTGSMPLRTGPDADRFRKTMRQYFNRVTLPRYFADWGTDTPEGKVAADNMAAWAAAEGYQLKTHLLLYPGYLPERVVNLKNDPDAFKREIELAMDDALARTASLPMHSWDALNELRTSTIVADVLGDSYYASVFNRGFESQPKAKWYINDFDVIESSPTQDSNIDQYESMIQKILDDGGKLSGIGFQGHFSEVVTPIPKVLAILDRFAKFGVPLEITEFDISTRDEQGQADYTRDLLTAIFSHPSTTGFTCWGFWEGSMWRPSGAMFRKDWSVKPNGVLWSNLIKKLWWTDETSLTDINGQVVIPAFHGRHHLELETDSEFFSKDVMVGKENYLFDLVIPGS